MDDRRETGGDDRGSGGTGDDPIRSQDEIEDPRGTADGPEDATPAAHPPDEDRGEDEGDDMSGIFGPRDEPREIVPGNPDPENALFVLLGVLVGVASLLELVGAL